jgi:hypothetical protein
MRARRTDEERRQLERRIEEGFRRIKVIGVLLVLALLVGGVLLIYLTRVALGVQR